MRQFLLLAFSGLLLAACAGPQSRMLTEDTALITVIAPSPDDRPTLVDATLKEAAKISREHGFRYFIILDAADASRTDVRFLPGDSVFTRSLPQSSSILNSRAPAYVPRSAFIPPDRKVQYRRPGLEITIRMYREGEVDPGRQGVWNGDVILGTLAAAR